MLLSAESLGVEVLEHVISKARILSRPKSVVFTKFRLCYCVKNTM